MKHLITKVDIDSIAEEIGIRSGWYLLSVNGQEVKDIIDYELFINNSIIRIECENTEGAVFEFTIHKEYFEPLGLNFSAGLMSPVRQCANHCIFCFIDQMPRGQRDTLYFKDDDWRLSLIMGNYVTLTNVSDAEFQRIIDRRVSPLYISVHATDGNIRARMMQSKNADKIMNRLTALRDNGLKFHAQIILCPAINDGKALENSLKDLYSLYPCAMSVAVAPVGLTKYRQGLYPLSPVTASQAREAIEIVTRFNSDNNVHGFAYCSDEMYLRADMELPDYECYGGFDQLENGVGLFRLFEYGFIAALNERTPLLKSVTFDAVCGTAIENCMGELLLKLVPYNINILLHAVKNEFFGNSVTVSGLVTAHDIISQLGDSLSGRALLIPSSMLRENEAVFLDGMTLGALEDELSLPVIPLPADDGEAFIDALFTYIERLIIE